MLIEISEHLKAIAKEVDRNVPDRRDPESFHVKKSEIANRLNKIAKELEQ